MDEAPKKKWWQRSWTFPASVLLHVLIVGAFYLQWPLSMEAPAEPESVSVELVEPPKDEPPKEEPPAKAEEQKAEEPPPPPQPPPPPAPPPVLPNVAVRPDGTQLDARDEAGKQEEEGGEEQTKPGDSSETAKAEEPMPAESAEAKPAETTPPDETPVETAEQAASNLQASAEEGEVRAAETPAEQDTAAVAVPLPRPEMPETQKTAQDNPRSGAGNPKLEPAKKLLASGERPRPMRRQILGDLPPQARVAQLCIAETMAQIRDSKGAYTGLKPHTAKNYPVSGNIMDAHGAFNIGNEWFPVDYRCEVDIDKYVVTDFRFNIGTKLTQQVVRQLNLQAE